MKIYLTAIIKAKSEFKNEVETILKNMVLQSNKEEACELYTLHQSIDDVNTFVFYEIWKNQEGLDFHNKQSYLQEFGAIIEEKLQEKPLIYKMKSI